MQDAFLVKLGNNILTITENEYGEPSKINN
jgi:hypothetical protein